MESAGCPPRSKISSLSALQDSIRKNVFKAVGAGSAGLEHEDNLGRNFLHTLASYRKRTHLMKTVDVSALPSDLFNQRDKQGFTPAMLAVAFRQFETLRYFLLSPSIRQKVEWRRTNFSGETVLDMATARQADPALLTLLQNIEEETAVGRDVQRQEQSDNNPEGAGSHFYSKLSTIADRMAQSQTLLRILEQDRREVVERQRQEENNLRATQTILEESLKESQRLELEHQRHLQDVLADLETDLQTQARLEEERARFERDCQSDKLRLTEKYSLLVREIEQQISEQRTAFLQLELSLESHYGRLRQTEEVPECPICLESLSPPRHIYQCLEGHLVCGDCRGKVAACSECRHEAGYQARNRALEQIIARNRNL